MFRYIVPKQTRTHADCLTAIGAADLLRHADPRLFDRGDRFEVSLTSNLKPGDLNAIDPGFAYFVRGKAPAPAVSPERIVTAGSPVGVEDRMYTILNRMKAYGGPGQLVARYARLKPGEWQTAIWDCLHGAENFVFRAPLVQLFDPHSVRGYAGLKPSGTDRRDRTKNQWANPFEQWLRYRGYFAASAGWFAFGDLRLFSPEPVDISYERLAKVAEGFREVRLGGTGPKMDCRAMFAFTRLLIESCRKKRRPREMVSGLRVTHYKDMGHTFTVIGMDQLALPNWMDLHTDEHARQWLAMLEEHDTAIRRLNDSHSEEAALLEQYRSTFQSDRQGSIDAFVKFLGAYGPSVFRSRSQDQWTRPQFSLRSVKEILDASPDCRLIVEAPGFAAVASAIRSATFGAQGNRHMGSVDHREIRYGLFASLRRAGMVGKQELSAAVGEFIGTYNRETVQRRAAGRRSSGISTVELEGFRRTVDRAPDSSLVAALLCGVSSCHRGETRVMEQESEMVQAALPA
jgi:hypothetical protein